MSKTFRNFTVFTGTSVTRKNDDAPKPTAKLIPKEFKNIRALYKAEFETPIQSDHKNADYIITAKDVEITPADPDAKGYRSKDHYHRNNKSVKLIQFIAIDGDKTESNPESCIAPELVEELMRGLKYSFILYTTHSHSRTRNRWRLLVPCICLPEHYKATCLRLGRLIKKHYPEFVISTEIMTLSQPWYIAARKNPDDGLHYSAYKIREQFKPVTENTPTPQHTEKSGESRTISESLENIRSGEGNHNEIRDLIYQQAKDGMPKDLLMLFGEKLLEESGRSNPEHENHSVWLQECNELEKNIDGAIERTKEGKNKSACINNVFELFEDITVNDEDIEDIENQTALVDGMIVKGHVSLFVAKPGAGKTALMIHLSTEIAKNNKLIYINLDSPAEEIKRHRMLAKRDGYQLVCPAIKKGAGLGNKEIIEKLEALIESDIDLSDAVLIIDTLKKCADVIHKSSIKEFLDKMRSLSARGCSVILLGHVNKYSDADGKLVYEGTGDIESDVDELTFLEFIRPDEENQIISTYSHKLRTMLVDPVTFEYKRKTREIIQKERFQDIRETVKISENVSDTDKDHILCIIETIQQGIVTETKIADAVTTKNSEFPIKSSRRLLKTLSNKNYPNRIFDVTRMKSKNNSLMYGLIEGFDVEKWKMQRAFGNR